MGPLNWTRHCHEKANARRPRFLKLRTSRWFITLVVSFASATDNFMYGVIVPVTPTGLRDRVGVPEGSIQAWTSILLALFSAALMASSPIVGYISDRTESRKGPFVVGLLALAAATALLCVGTHIGLWIAGRLLQGAAAGAVWVLGIALLVDTVGSDGLFQVIGYAAMATSVGILLGPLLGGVIYQYGGYYAVFGLAFGLLGVDLCLRLTLIEKKHAVRWLEPEEISTAPEQPVTEDSAVQKEGTDTNEETPRRDEAASLSGLKLVAHLLRSPRLMVALWGNFVVSLILTSFDSVLPLFVQQTFGWRQSGQGLIFIALAVPHVLDPVAGSVVDKFPKWCRFIASGVLLFSVPVMVLLRLVVDSSMQDKVLLCALLALLGVCIAFAVPPLAAEVFNAVREKEDRSPGIFGQGGAMALAFGLSGMGFAAGTLVGPFFAGFIRQRAGWATMSWALAIMVGVSSVPILLFMGGWILKQPARPADEAVELDSRPEV